MRLTEKERLTIKQAVNAFDPQAVIYLFGSRVFDEKKGGDIDLLVFSSKIMTNEKREIKLMLYDRIGEQKIDLLVAKDNRDPFVQMAQENGVLL